MDNVQLEAIVGIENEHYEPEQDHDGLEEDRRVQVIADGIELAREAIEGMGDGPVPDAYDQQLQDLIPLLQLLAVAIQVMFRNLVHIQPRIEQPHIPAIHFDLGQVPRLNCQLLFHFSQEEILQMVIALQIPEIPYLTMAPRFIVLRHFVFHSVDLLIHAASLI